MPNYSPRETRELFRELPFELKDAIVSEETANTISRICEKNNASGRSSAIAKQVGYMLMGLLPPSEFLDVLQKEVKLKKENAKEVSKDINRFILYPIKNIVRELYENIEFAPGGRLKTIAPIKDEGGKKETEEEEKKEEKKEESSYEDTYREPLS